MEYSTRQFKRKYSDDRPSEPPSYSEVGSPLSTANSPTETYQLGKPRDDDLVSAAEVLTQFQKSPPPHDMSANASTLASPMSSTSHHDWEQQQHPLVLLVSAVSKHPIVTNAVKYYESSKRNYASFNYAAGIVEKAAIPVISKIEVNLNNMHQARIEEKIRLKKKRRIGLQTESPGECQRRLKFCLHILKLANDNINSKVSFLQQKIADKENEVQAQLPILGVHSDVKSEYITALKIEVKDEKTQDLTADASTIPQEAQETKTEIIATVKKIIHVISNFRPSTLNVETEEESEKETEDVKLKSTIREIILNLPNQIQQTAGPSSVQANDRIILFARESLEMINRLTNVFNDQLVKAESWVDGDNQTDRHPEVVRSPLDGSADSVETKYY